MSAKRFRCERTEHIEGEIDPRAGLEPGGTRARLTVHILGSVPTPRDRGSPWEGMSGAPLFSGPLLVGVVVVDPARFDPDRLEAVPLTVLAAERDFRIALTGRRDTPLVLAAVEALGVLRDPYLSLPVRPHRIRRRASASCCARSSVWSGSADAQLSSRI